MESQQKPPVRTQGMNWVSQHKRLAIYLRDGLACAYCGATLEDGTKFTLDHLTPYSEGGSNEAKNLVTCCARCNSSRGTRPYKEFAAATAGYLGNGITGEAIVRHIQNCVRRVVNTQRAKAMVDRRGSCFKVLESIIYNKNE